MVDCLAGLCDAPCPAYPNAICTINYCEDGTVNGVAVPPCKPVYLDRDGSVVNCTLPEEDIYP
jgi:hypothetical protein